MRAPRIHVLAPVALVSFFLIAAAARLTPPAAAASRAGFTMEVLVDGRPLAELPHGGKRYVEARRGKDYAVRLTNHTGERVAVALSVDGLNSIDAKRASARESTKWILGPWQSIVVQGAGVNQCLTCSGSVHAIQTSAGGTST